MMSHVMPLASSEGNNRMSLRIAYQDKSLLLRAAALQQTNLTEFVIRIAIEHAYDVIEHHERIQLTERGSLQVLDLLENPPVPNKKLLAAALALPKRTV